MFTEYIEKCIENLDVHRKDIFLLGDMNIDSLDKKSDASVKLRETMTQLGFTNLIKTPTRFSRVKNSCIDHVYTNSNMIYTSGVLDEGIVWQVIILYISRPISNFHCCQFMSLKINN